MTFDERRSWRLMGVVNVTPDSFSDGGVLLDPKAAVDYALKLAEDGADILDIGGESTRPGADEVSIQEELDRVMPVVEGLAGKTASKISIDTRKPAVARAAIAAGVHIWNDVTALTFAENSVEAARDLGCEVVLMHAQGDPKTMQKNPVYSDVVHEVATFLEERIAACRAAGIALKKLTIDPGVGFGKTLEHNLALITGLERLAEVGPPVLLGASRKRFIAAIDRDGPAANRLGGSIATVLAGYARGASIFRVHDVAETRQALRVAEAIEKARSMR